jgi:hypothetical protein
MMVISRGILRRSSAILLMQTWCILPLLSPVLRAMMCVAMQTFAMDTLMVDHRRTWVMGRQRLLPSQTVPRARLPKGSFELVR